MKDTSPPSIVCTLKNNTRSRQRQLRSDAIQWSATPGYQRVLIAKGRKTPVDREDRREIHRIAATSSTICVFLGPEHVRRTWQSGV